MVGQVRHPSCSNDRQPWLTRGRRQRRPPRWSGTRSTRDASRFDQKRRLDHGGPRPPDDPSGPARDPQRRQPRQSGHPGIPRPRDVIRSGARFVDQRADHAGDQWSSSAPTASTGPIVRESTDTSAQRNGNNVQLDRELLEINKAMGDFNAAQTVLAAKFRLVRYAINDGR